MFVFWISIQLHINIFRKYWAGVELPVIEQQATDSLPFSCFFSFLSWYFFGVLWFLVQNVNKTSYYLRNLAIIAGEKALAKERCSSWNFFMDFQYLELSPPTFFLLLLVSKNCSFYCHQVYGYCLCCTSYCCQDLQFLVPQLISYHGKMLNWE